MTATGAEYDDAGAVVYRIYDKTNRLIYVGASTTLGGRLNCHRTQSWWYGLVERVVVERYPARAEAFSAEAEAIRSERPAFNLASGGRRTTAELSEEDLRICREWTEQPGQRGAGRIPPLAVRRLLATRA